MFLHFLKFIFIIFYLLLSLFKKNRFCALCCCRCLPKLKQFFFNEPDRRGSGQRGGDHQPPAPNYSKSKSASICSTAQLPTSLIATKRGSNAQQPFKPVQIEVTNQSSPTPPATANQSTINLSNRRLSAINISSFPSTSPILSNINTISGGRVPFPHSPQPISKSQAQHQLRSAAVHSSSAINELGLGNNNAHRQQQQTKIPRTRASISNLLMSPKITENLDYQYEHLLQPNNNDFEFKNLNYSTAAGLRAPTNKQRKYSCVAAIAPTSEAFATHHATYLPNQLPAAKTRRHSKAIGCDLPSPSQLRKQSNLEYENQLALSQQAAQQYNERTTLNRKKYSLANHHVGDNTLDNQAPNDQFTSLNSHLINKPLIQTQQQDHVRKYSNSSTPSSSRKQSRSDLQQQQQSQFLRDEQQEQLLQDFNDEFSDEQFATHQNSKYTGHQKRHSTSHYHPGEIVDQQRQQQQTDYNQYEPN